MHSKISISKIKIQRKLGRNSLVRAIQLFKIIIIPQFDLLILNKAIKNNLDLIMACNSRSSSSNNNNNNNNNNNKINKALQIYYLTMIGVRIQNISKPIKTETKMVIGRKLTSNQEKKQLQIQNFRTFYLIFKNYVLLAKQRLRMRIK